MHQFLQIGPYWLNRDGVQSIRPGNGKDKEETRVINHLEGEVLTSYQFQGKAASQIALYQRRPQDFQVENGVVAICDTAAGTVVNPSAGRAQQAAA